MLKIEVLRVLKSELVWLDLYFMILYNSFIEHSLLYYYTKLYNREQTA